MNNSSLNGLVLGLSFSIGIPLIVLATRVNPDDAKDILVHMADAAKEWAITTRVCLAA